MSFERQKLAALFKISWLYFAFRNSMSMHRKLSAGHPSVCAIFEFSERGDNKPSIFASPVLFLYCCSDLQT